LREDRLSRTEVLVVGAGPTGLLAALRLAERGVPVEVIDEEWRPAGHSYALALHARSLELLRELGVADEVVAAGQRLDTLALFEGKERRALLRLGPGIAHFPFVLALPQSTLEELLVRKLTERGVGVRWSHRLAGLERRADKVVASVQRLQKESTGYAVAHTEWAVDKTLVVEAGYVIGADGHRSLVRHGLGLAFEEAGRSEVFAVFECAQGETPADELRLVLDEHSLSALWPLPGSRARWSLSLEAPEVAAWDRFKSRLTTRLGERYFHHLDEAGLRQLLRERAPWFEPSLGEIGWSIEVRFERRLAAQFGRGRIWLAGDAAHLTGPAGMQSMNAGLHEAWDLATRIAAIRAGEGGIEKLEEYGQQCLSAWRFLLGRAGGLRSGPATPGFVARDPARLLPCLPATGPELTPLAAQLGLSVDRA
jgi:2-polyprenyl-6-methoxyphenol hydroxylase-like FAD-dependent oxidoreductase